jgi:hypothetical protein
MPCPRESLRDLLDFLIEFFPWPWRVRLGLPGLCSIRPRDVLLFAGISPAQAKG